MKPFPVSCAVLQLCKFTAPVPHLAVYTGICEPLSPSSPLPCELLPPSPGLITLPNSAACPSPISVAIDSTPASERKFDGTGGSMSAQFPSITESAELSMGSDSSNVTPGPPKEARPPPPRSRVALSFSRFLKRGCATSPVFATLSPKCPSVASGRIQPLNNELLSSQPTQKPKRIANFFQIKVDIPPECRIYPIDSEEEEEEECPAAGRAAVKEVICPWETVSEEGKAG
ncbi:regulator of G-protein signaling 9-like [Amia ocellicauda]|uniref:regulator of G-protein signaling 9-like n=1 Tax=Amia ocellicauda TaxID=2972642 RepID=UPI0034644EC1